ncbi:Demethylmenaquinone methyltransferase 2 [Colletotrichum chlorophyti]|uniref:Demethylmenaquinone methyltransferase 2 n=1 Tax=Colletotrichum chlorophyti TaxID=708187 RepID=A0A1Q8S4G7_9PEZI|nr:Demethylmenaquinone methyltransferase 2 [Colletotrichum chlorophyti]
MAEISQPPRVSHIRPWDENYNALYPLNEGDLDTERQRLDSNHYKVRMPLCGGLCPPHILQHLKSLPSPRVIELAAGTGVWLRDLADHLPASASLVGVDMDAVKFPPAAELPPNMTMMQQNALKPFPDDMLGTFDMVHIRLISMGLKKEDWEVVARNIYTLLKPGGYVHWEEMYDIGWRCIPPSRPFDEWCRLTALWSIQCGRDLFMPAQLPNLLEDVGYVGVDDKVWNTFGARGLLRDHMTQVSKQALRPILLAIVEGGGLENVQSIKDVDRLEEEMKRDVEENGVLVGFMYTWIWGQRP